MSENRRPTMDMDTSPFSTTFPSTAYPNLPTTNTLSTPKPTKPNPKHVDFAALSLTGGRKARSGAMGKAGEGTKGEKGKTGGGKRRVSVPMATRRSNLAESPSEEEEGEGEDSMDVDVDEDEQQRKELEKKERTHLAVEVDTQRMQLISPPPEEVLVLERGRSVSGHGRRESTTNVYPYAPNTLSTPGRSPGAGLTSLRLNASGSGNASLDATAANRNANASNTGSGSSKRKRPQAASAAAAFITPSSSRSSKGSTSPEEEEEEDASMRVDGGHDYEQQQQYQEEQEQHEPVEATPNPKPRKQGRLARMPSMAGSPTKGPFASGEMVRRSPMGMDKARAQGSPRTLAERAAEKKAPTTPTKNAKLKSKRVVVQSPHVKNPDADYILPVAVPEEEEDGPLGSLKLKNPSVRRAVLSSRGSRRSATPIPPYEPPTDVFTPPREVFISPISAPPRSSRKSAAAAAASAKKKGKGLRVNTLIMQTQVKQEIPDDIDLSAPMPPASPTDDPLLLSGPPEPEPGAVLEQEEEVVQRRSVEVQVQMQAPDLPPSSPEPPLDTDDAEAIGAFDWHREAGDTSIDSSMMELDDPADAEVEPVRLFDFPLGDAGGGWSDSDDDGDTENVPKGGALESEGEGEYTGHWRTLKVLTKQDPPSSATRCRMEDWGRPISPFPYQRAMPLVGEEEEEEVRRMSVEPEVPVQQQTEEEAREEEEVRRMSVEPEPEPEPEQVQVQQEQVPEIVQVPEAVDASPEDDEESSDGDDDPGLVKITSADPRAAARAVAILKQHDYECYTKLVKRRRVSLDDIARDNRRKSLAAHGVSKTKTKNGAQARSRRSMGVIGERVYIPGSPVVTLPELLEQVEKDVVGLHQQETQVWNERRQKIKEAEVFETPVPARSKSANANAFDFDSSRRLSSLSATTTFPSLLPLAVDSEGDGPRPWTKDAWKLLDACFTDQRLELGIQQGTTDGSLADVESVRVEDVVQRFVEICGGWEKVGRSGEEWDRENLVQRAEALKKKQRAGKVAPPTTPFTPITSVATRAPGSLAFASPTLGRTAIEVPDFTPLQGLRQLRPQSSKLDVSDASSTNNSGSNNSGSTNSGRTSLGALNRNRAPPPPRRSLLGPAVSRPPVLPPPPPPHSSDGPFQNLGPEPDDDDEQDDNGPRRRKRLPGSLLAPRYSHLLEEARAVSEGLLGGGLGGEERDQQEETSRSSIDTTGGEDESEDTSVDNRHEGDDTSQDASASFDDSNDDQHSDEEDDDEPTLHAPPSSQPAQQQPSTISTRVKGFLFSYLPTLSSSTLAAKSKSLKPVKQQHGLPLPPPPPSLLTKPRKPVQTPAKPAPTRGPVPKELVNLHNVPLPQPKALVAKGRRDPPRRMVELVPVPQEVLDKTVNVLEREKEKRGRRSSGSSVRDLIKGFEEMEREQEQKGMGKEEGRG